jgi:hypothetical protein
VSAADQGTLDVLELLRADAAALPQAAEPLSVGFVTRQGARHAGRRTCYRNEVVSLRLHASVGSAACEPGDVTDAEVFDCVGRPVGELLAHAASAIRVAALDALLQHARPVAGVPVDLPAGSSVAKSQARARAVVDLLPSLPAGSQVAVVGVVNSLLDELRRRDLAYIPCDLKGGRTEWDEEVRRDATDLAVEADALLVSGMTLANGTFDGLAAQARSAGTPLVVFAQTGAGIFPHLLQTGVTAVSAEPWPFFWLGGEPTRIHLHRAMGGTS